MDKTLSLLFSLLLVTGDAYSAEVTDAFVDDIDDHYVVRVEMRVEAELESVYAILTDFNNLHRLNRAIKKSQLLKSEAKRHLVRIEAIGCVWFFCQEVIQTQWITEQGRGYISAVTLPEQSNLEYGRVLWHIRQQGEFTLISYRTDIVPKFFVPPLIGTYLMKNKMLEEAQETIQNLERLAQFDEKY